MFKISILAVSLVLSASLEAITSEDGQFHASYAFDGGILIKKRAKNGWYQVHKVPASEDAIRSKEWVERSFFMSPTLYLKSLSSQSSRISIGLS